MTENGENEKAVSTFILKISRKLRDRYLSGLARRKVTCETIFSFFFCLCMYVCVCVSTWADSMERTELQAGLTIETSRDSR